MEVIFLQRCSAALAVTFLGACASHSGVAPMGAGVYMISKQAATGIGGLGNLKAEVLQDAEKHCTEKATQLEVVKVTENEGPFVLGKYPRAEVQFRCMPKS